MDRRRFLTAAAGAPVLAIPAIASAASPVENPEILQLVPELEAAQAAYVAAAARKAAARAAYDAIVPAIPDEMILRRVDDISVFRATAERDVEGACVYPLDRQPRLILSSERLAQEATLRDGRTRDGRHFRRRARAARLYEAAELAAREQTGVEDAIGELISARIALCKVVDRIAPLPVKTMEGVAIKARAIMAFRAVDNASGVMAGTLYGAQLAADVVRLSLRGAT